MMSPLGWVMAGTDSSAVAGLSRSDPSSRGISRIRIPAGFGYRDPAGADITNPATLERIRALARPPAWESVWISADPLGHIQAMARASRGRTPYRDHQLWREQREGQQCE